MASSANLYLQSSKMPYLEEPKMQLTPEDFEALQKRPMIQNEKEVPWGKTEEGKATIAGAQEGMKTGSLSNTLTSAGISNMINAGTITPVGGALTGAGVALNAIEEGNAVDYNNRKMIADEQARAHNAKVAGLYAMMKDKNYGIV